MIQGGKVQYHQLLKDLKQTIKQNEVQNKLFIDNYLLEQIQIVLKSQKTDAKTLITDLLNEYSKLLSAQSPLKSNKPIKDNSHLKNQKIESSYKKRVQNLQIQLDQKNMQINKLHQKISHYQNNYELKDSKKQQKVLTSHDSDKLLSHWKNQRDSFEKKVQQYKAKIIQALNKFKQSNQKVLELKTQLNKLKEYIISKIKQQQLSVTKNIAQNIKGFTGVESTITSAGVPKANQASKNSEQSKQQNKIQGEETNTQKDNKQSKVSQKPNNQAPSLFEFKNQNTIFGGNSTGTNIFGRTGTINNFGDNKTNQNSNNLFGLNPANPFGNSSKTNPFFNPNVNNSFSRPSIQQPINKSAEGQKKESSIQIENKPISSPQQQSSLNIIPSNGNSQPNRGQFINLLRQLKKKTSSSEIQSKKIQIRQLSKQIEQYKKSLMHLLDYVKNNVAQFVQKHQILALVRNLQQIIPKDNELKQNIRSIKQVQYSFIPGYGNRRAEVKAFKYDAI